RSLICTLTPERNNARGRALGNRCEADCRSSAAQVPRGGALITPDISVVGVGAFDSATSSTAPTVDDLFRLYGRRVRGLARRRLGDNALADDVVQETFVRAHKALGGFDSRRDAWPWLAQIARNLCVDVARSASSSAQCAS